jgi:hypothetical protein
MFVELLSGTRQGMANFAVHQGGLKMETAKGRENFSYVEFKQYLLKVMNYMERILYGPV